MAGTQVHRTPGTIEMPTLVGPDSHPLDPLRPDRSHAIASEPPFRPSCSPLVQTYRSCRDRSSSLLETRCYFFTSEVNLPFRRVDDLDGMDCIG